MLLKKNINKIIEININYLKESNYLGLIDAITSNLYEAIINKKDYTKTNFVNVAIIVGVVVFVVCMIICCVVCRNSSESYTIYNDGYGGGGGGWNAGPSGGSGGWNAGPSGGSGGWNYGQRGGGSW